MLSTRTTTTPDDTTPRNDLGKCTDEKCQGELYLRGGIVHCQRCETPQPDHELSKTNAAFQEEQKKLNAKRVVDEAAAEVAAKAAAAAAVKAKAKLPPCRVLAVQILKDFEGQRVPCLMLTADAEDPNVTIGRALEAAKVEIARCEPALVLGKQRALLADARLLLGKARSTVEESRTARANAIRNGDDPSAHDAALRTALGRHRRPHEPDRHLAPCHPSARGGATARLGVDAVEVPAHPHDDHDGATGCPAGASGQAVAGGPHS